MIVWWEVISFMCVVVFHVHKGNWMPDWQDKIWKHQSITSDETCFSWRGICIFIEGVSFEEEWDVEKDTSHLFIDLLNIGRLVNLFSSLSPNHQDIFHNIKQILDFFQLKVISVSKVISDCTISTIIPIKIHIIRTKSVLLFIFDPPSKNHQKWTRKKIASTCHAPMVTPIQVESCQKSLQSKYTDNFDSRRLYIPIGSQIVATYNWRK